MQHLANRLRGDAGQIRLAQGLFLGLCHACSPSLTSTVYHLRSLTATPLPVDPLVVVAASGPGLHWEPSHTHLSSFLDDMSYCHAFVPGGAIYGDWPPLYTA